MFIDAWLGLCSAVGSGAATEITAPGYARQAISFGEPIDGVSFSATVYEFGQMVRLAEVAGRAIYDAPSGGRLLLCLPFPVPLSRWRPLWDSGDAGAIRLQFTALPAFPRGAAYSGTLAAGATIGSVSDRFDIVNPVDLSASIANPAPLINQAAMTAGVALTISRGILFAT